VRDQRKEMPDNTEKSPGRCCNLEIFLCRRVRKRYPLGLILFCYNRGYILFITVVIMHPMFTVKVTTVGNSVGIILPRELLARLRVDKGDVLYLVETPSGVELTPYDPQFAAQMQALESVAREERDVLKKLAQQDE